MRKVIKGKVYDTKTASLIVALPGTHAKNHSKWSETCLFRTPRGGYFLAGEGGALSRWAEVTPSGFIPGRGIEVVAKDEARVYAIYAGLSRDRFVRAGFDPIEP